MYHQLRWFLLSFDKSLDEFEISEKVRGEKSVGNENS
jgi:hypothetical protein